MEWYDFPQYYDLGFDEETRLEIPFIEAAAKEFVRGARRKRILEPGCGTGRLVIPLAKRGYEVTAFDLNPNTIQYLNRRLRRGSLNAETSVQDMQSFTVEGQFDVVLNTINTFRHLLTEKAALQHLHSVASVLRPGGIFILGLHVMPPDADWKCTERWRATRGRTSVFFTLRVLKWELRKRLEHLRVNMLIRKHQQPPIRVRTDMVLRIYRLKQLLSLLRKIPELEIVGSYDFWYDLDDPVELDDDISDLVLVLRKK